MCHPWPWATCTLNRGQSGRGLSPTLGGTGTFVFLPPASCHLQRSHWPSANDLQLSADREKRWNSSLSTSGFISALGERFVVESQGKPVCGWDLHFTGTCTSLIPQRQFINSASVLAGMVHLLPWIWREADIGVNMARIPWTCFLKANIVVAEEDSWESPG